MTKPALTSFDSTALTSHATTERQGLIQATIEVHSGTRQSCSVCCAYEAIASVYLAAAACNQGKHTQACTPHTWNEARKKKERKVYAIRHHSGSLSAQKQPEVE